MRRILAWLVLLAAAASPALAQRAGVYEVAGTNPDGTSYAGIIGLRQVGLASWQVLWDLGETRFEGYGMSSGTTFAVGFALGQRPGIAIYSVGADGSMTGQWTLVGTSAIGTETLTPRAGPPGATVPGPPPAPQAPALQAPARP